MISCRDHHCFSNTVIGWSFRVCLGAEELEQWYGDRRDFLANLPTHATRASRSPRFRPCYPDIRKKSRLFCRLNYARTNIFKYSYFNRIVDMWNSLPHSVRRAHSVEIFKKSVRDILIRSLWLLISFHFIVSIILFTIVFYSNYLVFIGLVLLPYCSVIIIQ